MKKTHYQAIGITLFFVVLLGILSALSENFVYEYGMLDLILYFVIFNYLKSEKDDE